jgi:hypothetical protein
MGKKSRRSRNRKQKSKQESPSVPSAAGVHLLCGGNTCSNNDPHCQQVTIMQKDTSKGHVRDNIKLVCCMVAQQFNECLRLKKPLVFSMGDIIARVCSKCGGKDKQLTVCSCGEVAYCSESCMSADNGRHVHWKTFTSVRLH